MADIRVSPPTPDSPPAQPSTAKLSDGGVARRLLLAALVLVAATVAVGATTSSVAALERLAGEGGGLTIGMPQPIRTDEYLRTTPWRLGLTQNGADTITTPLAHPQGGLITLDPDGPASVVLFPEGAVLETVGRALPTQALALAWWLPLTLAALLLPVWLRGFGVPNPIGLPATVLILLAPSSVWWSFLPVQVLGWALLAGTCALWAYRAPPSPWHWRTVLPVAGAGLGLARLALSYTPWAVPVGLMIAVPTAVRLLTQPGGRRRGLGVALAVGAVGALLVAWFLWENREAVQILAQTAYPGQRREGGQQMPVWLLLGAPHLWANLLPGSPVVDSNDSELSSAYLVLALPALILVAAIGRFPRKRLLELIGFTVPLLLLVVWVCVTLPEWTELLVPLSLAVPPRVAQVAGIGATLAFAVVLAQWRSKQVRATRRGAAPRTAAAAWASATGVSLLTAAGGSALQAVLPSLAPGAVLAGAAAMGAVVFVPVRHPAARWALLPACALAVVVGAAVNPVQVGVHPLQGSEAATRLTAVAAEHPGGYWMTDDPIIDAVLMANGQPGITGQQWVGPNRDAWAMLDPGSAKEEVWNRGASTIAAEWSDDRGHLTLSNPWPDRITIRVDPCHPALRHLGMTRIVSSEALVRPCLQPAGSFPWGGTEKRIYVVTG